MIGIGALTLLTPPLLHRGTLIDQIPFGWTAVVAAIGVAIGSAVVIRLNAYLEQQPKRQAYALVIGLPILLAICGTYYLRLGVELFAFHSATTTTSTIPATVTGVTRRYADLRLEPESREFHAKVSGELRAHLDPYRVPGRDCILFEVEVGRLGWRRTKVPNFFDDPIDHARLVPCPAT
ncbi:MULTISPECIES: hypothetical protein [unclassified Sphingomonas]|uniref:hypothetical protein n=1 Tax=unclassified Sphingomonas TaxID=196159 RepID=UPI000AC5CD52|nr:MULTISPECIES: hypothetical protein [unclassified Sphingomonas]